MQRTRSAQAFSTRRRQSTAFATGLTPAVQRTDSERVSSPQIDILAFLPLVRSIAVRIYATIPPYASVELNDLMQSGHLGLLHASRAYQSTRNVPFAVYAKFRIRGEILDSLRQVDMASRSMRRLQRRILLDEQRLGASPSELAHPSAPAPMVPKTTSLDDPLALTSTPLRTSEPGPETLRANDELQSLLGKAIERLPDRSRQVIRLYYSDGLTMRQIGDRFQINESRVSQIHRTALTRMARSLRSLGLASPAQI